MQLPTCRIVRCTVRAAKGDQQPQPDLIECNLEYEGKAGYVCTPLMMSVHACTMRLICYNFVCVDLKASRCRASDNIDLFATMQIRIKGGTT